MDLARTRRSSAPLAISHVWTAVQLAAAPAAALGLARFGYSLLLPAMRSDLHWSFAQAGALNASNAAGYLFGAVAFGTMTRNCGLRESFLLAMVVVASSVLLCSLTSDYALLLTLRAVTGVASAFALIGGATLTAHLGSGLTDRRQALLISIYFAGGGAGVALATLLAPAVLAAGSSSWKTGWQLLGAICVLCVFALPPRGPLASASRRDPVTTVSSLPSLVPMGVAFLLFGAGAIAFMTFVIADLLEKGASPVFAGQYWLALGLASACGNFLWSPVLARLRGGKPLALVTGVSALGTLALLVSSSAFGAFASASLFGLALLAAPSAVTAFVQKVRPAADWSRSLGRMTALFGLGQCVGPMLVGLISDSPAGSSLGLAVSAATLVAASVASLLQRHPAGAVVTR